MNRYEFIMNGRKKAYLLILSSLLHSMNILLISCKVKNFMEITGGKGLKKVFI